ncbi:hypothetical protein FACS1894178_4410 [Bacteroidia bacterium]|nr:hypothetical protein FACS1894178_4410 [Bacteroidia bacterium]
METNYEKAYQELATIVMEIEKGDIGLDQLSEKIKQATQLLKICREKLMSTEKEVATLIEDLP